MRKVTANIYQESGFRGGRGNKVFVTTSDGIVVIDTPLFPSDSIKWSLEISKIGPVRYLLNTDQHADHFQGNHFFPGTIVAHEETRKAMAVRGVDAVMGFVNRLDPQSLPFMQGYQVKLPDITFNETLTLYLGNHSFELIPLPGHAPGVIGVHLPQERALWVSDCVFCKTKTYMQEAAPEPWLDSLKKLEGLDVDLVLPGHGEGTCTREYLREQAGVIRGWVDAVKTAIKQGLTKEEALAKVACPDPYPMPPFGAMSEAELNKVTIANLYERLRPATGEVTS